MSESSLNIISISPEMPSEQTYRRSKKDRRIEMEAKFERLWLTNPQQFNPLRNCMERERLERTWQLILKYISFSSHQKIVDIGCASGIFSRRLRDAGAWVEAVDIAENALKKCREAGADNIKLTQTAMPNTLLLSQNYKVIICTELIAEIPPEDYRLFFAELARLVELDGYLICSSSIDIYSTGGVNKLIELAQTEFNIIEDISSYHALYFRLMSYMKTPTRFIESWRNPEYKKKKMKDLSGFSYFWYKLNTSPLLIWFWYACKPFSQIFENLLRNNSKVLLFLEKVCKFFLDQEGISHYLFIAKKRPLSSTLSNIN